MADHASLAPANASPPQAPPAWNEQLLANPHAVTDKRTRVRQMFAAIAPSYDLNNHLHSLYIDQYWRREAVKLSQLKPEDQVVDVACGTGDLSLAFLANVWYRHSAAPRAAQVIGIDFTHEMLPFARRKAARMLAVDRVHQGIDPGDIQFLAGDAQALPLPDASCDVVSIAFGIRNVQDPLAALREFRRVLRPGGRVIVLEFSIPTNALVRWAYNLYCSKVMPLTATWISGDKSGAYKYLPHSVETFLTPTQMTQNLQSAGFTDILAKPLTFGAVVVYRGMAT